MYGCDRYEGSRRVCQLDSTCELNQHWRPRPCYSERKSWRSSGSRNYISFLRLSGWETTVKKWSFADTLHMPAILISCCLSQIQWSIHAITSLILEPRIKVTLAFPYQRSNSVMVTTTNGVVRTIIIIHLNPTVTIAIAIRRLHQIVVYPSVVSSESCHHYDVPAS